jgi:hypothetical protein
MTATRTEERRRWKKRHPDLLREQKRRYKQRLRARGVKLKKYSKGLKKYDREKQAQHNKAWRAKNPGVVKGWQLRRRIVCPWDIRDITNTIYLIARAYRSVGISCHVDHIIPLNGETVSGLHVHTNLTLLPAEHNLKKGNGYGDAAFQLLFGGRPV